MDSKTDVNPCSAASPRSYTLALTHGQRRALVWRLVQILGEAEGNMTRLDTIDAVAVLELLLEDLNDTEIPRFYADRTLSLRL